MQQQMARNLDQIYLDMKFLKSKVDALHHDVNIIIRDGVQALKGQYENW